MKRSIFLGILVALALAACMRESKFKSVSDPTANTLDSESELEMVTLLPKDAIPAIDTPEFISAQEADSYYFPEERVIGVVFDGESRAYSIPLLSSYEIVNDTVGGHKIAVTW